MKFKLILVMAVTLLSLAHGDQCGVGSVKIEGNWFCQEVTAIQYTNVGYPGTYDRVIEMPPSGICVTEPVDFSGPLAPLNKEVSIHIRGPVQLKQFAAYVPSALKKTRREDSFARRKGHQHLHRKINKDKATLEKREDWVTATINGQVVSWVNNWFGTPSKATPIKAAAEDPVMVTATIDGKVVSWTNNWFGFSTTSPTPTSAPEEKTKTVHVLTTLSTRTTTVTISEIAANNEFEASTPTKTADGATETADMVTATIDGKIVSWTSNYYPGSVTVKPTSPITPLPVAMTSSAVPISQPSIDSLEIAVPSAPPAVSILAHSPQAGSNAGFEGTDDYTRIGYYDSTSQVLDNLVFLGNHGGQGSGVFDMVYGASLSYVDSTGTNGAEGPEILEDHLLPSGNEIAIMLGQECEDDDCGFVRPGSVAYHGFDGADKVFLFEFSMPHDGDSGYNGDMPAIWMLNADIPRTQQYGSAGCSCWHSGCGEFDIVEALFPGSDYLKSTLHTNTPGGDSDYILRPTDNTIKLAVVFDSGNSTAHIRVLEPWWQDFAFCDCSINCRTFLQGKITGLSSIAMTYDFLYFRAMVFRWIEKNGVVKAGLITS